MAMVKFKAPALPSASNTYNAMQQQQLIRALELYFNRLDSDTPITAEYFLGSGRKITNMYGQFINNTSQFAVGANDAQPIEFDPIRIVAGGMELVGDTDIEVNHEGVFKVTSVIVFGNSTGSDGTVIVELNLVGDAGYTPNPTTVTVPAGSLATVTCIDMVPLAPSVPVQVLWQTTDVGVVVDSINTTVEFLSSK